MNSALALASGVNPPSTSAITPRQWLAKTAQCSSPSYTPSHLECAAYQGGGGNAGDVSLVAISGSGKVGSRLLCCCVTVPGVDVVPDPFVDSVHLSPIERNRREGRHVARHGSREVLDDDSPEGVSGFVDHPLHITFRQRFKVNEAVRCVGVEVHLVEMTRTELRDRVFGAAVVDVRSSVALAFEMVFADVLVAQPNGDVQVAFWLTDFDGAERQSADELWCLCRRCLMGCHLVK